MAHYIDKDVLMSEIENLLDKGRYNEEYDCAYRDGNNGALHALKNKLNTLEVKEVDLDKEIDDYINEHFFECGDGVLISDANSTELTLLDVTSIAKHFFELGLKVQKGE